MTFGEKIKLLRTDRNMSQEEFATLLGTSKQVISRYELGQTTPKIDIVAEWCRILSVSLDDMLNDEKSVYDNSSAITEEKVSTSADTVSGYDKNIFARNLNNLMEKANKTRSEICQALNLNYFTFSDWCNGKKFPQIDKIELLADYFGCSKADLIEDHTGISLSPVEREIITQYRAKTNLQHAVCVLLGVSEA